MSRNTTHRSSEIEFNGKLCYAVFGAATAAAATQRFGEFVAPCDGKIRVLARNITTQATHATNDLSFGTLADIDSHLNEVDITNAATGYIDYCTGVEGTEPLLDLDIVAGQVYAWGWVGGDTTGHMATVVVIEPV